MLSRRDYAKMMADPKRSEAAQTGALKRTRNEHRIDALEAKNRKLIEALRAANKFLHDNAPEGDETLALTSRLLKELGEES